MASELEEETGLPLPEGPIYTERLELRKVAFGDLPALLEIHRVVEVNRYLPLETWEGMDDAKRWYDKALQRHRDGEAIQWVIGERGGKRLYGSCILFGYEADNERAELGYCIGRPHWGQGIAREAVARLVDYAFGELGLRRLDARVDPRNGASGRLLRRLGFTHEGCLRQRQYLKGELVDVDLFGLLRPEWCPP